MVGMMEKVDDSDKEILSLAAVVDDVTKFLRGYQPVPKVFKYFTLLEQIGGKEFPVLEVQYPDLVNWSFDASKLSPEEMARAARLAANLISDPQQTIEAFRLAAIDVIKSINSSEKQVKALAKALVVRFYGLEDVAAMNFWDLRPEHLDTLVSLDGVINSVEKSRPFAKRMAYKCSNCRRITMAPESYFLRHKAPGGCVAGCEGGSGILQEYPAKAENVSFQRMALQPLHEKADSYAAVEDIKCWVAGDDLMYKVQPGERARLVGIVMAKPLSDNNKAINSLHEYYLWINSITSLKDQEIQEDVVAEEVVKDTVLPATEDEDYVKLVNSVCPSHYGDDAIKESLLLMLVGGEAHIMQDGNRIRGDINILLASNPGAGKTQLFRWTTKTATRSVYAAGKGVTKAGLTATPFREEDGIVAVRHGAYLYADRGIVAIDELDKVQNEEKEALASVMDDQQTFFLNKMGINRTYSARCSSLHGCNPVGGKWDVSKTFEQNVPFAHWLFDRYDLKFVMLNHPDAEVDKAKADHFGKMLINSKSERALKVHGANTMMPVEGTYSPQYLKTWIAYVKKTYDPSISPEVMDEIAAFYLKLRGTEQTKEISMREQGALYRLATASARAHQRHQVSSVDVQIGINLIMMSFRSCGIDPETGELNYRFTTSVGGSEAFVKQRNLRFRKTIEDMAGGGDVTREQLVIEAMKDYGVSEKETKELINMFIQQGRLYVSQPGWIQIVKAKWRSKS